MPHAHGTVDTGSMLDFWKRTGRRDFWKPKEGDNLIYICPPSRGDDRLAFYPIWVHYKVGPKENMVVCLDQERNEILAHPHLKSFLADKDIDGGCPVCAEIDAGRMGDDQKASRKYLWNVVPVAFREDAKGTWQAITPVAVAPMFEGYTIWDGLLEVFANEGNVTNPDEAIFVRINRKGTGLKTKYSVQVDSGTVRKPKSLDRETREQIATALAEGGTCDPYQMLAKLTAPRPKVAALMQGVEYSEGESYEEDGEKKTDGSVGLLGDSEDGDETPTAAAAPTEPADDEEGSGSSLEEARATRAASGTLVSDCQKGETYLINGKHLADFVGLAKGVGVFSTEEGEIIKLKEGAKVEPLGGDDASEPEEEATAEVDDEEPAEVKRLRAELAKKRKARAVKK